MTIPYRRLLSLVALTALLGGCESVPDAPAFDAADGKVTVTFVHPESFADASDRNMGPTSQHLLDEISGFLQREVRRYLPAGEKFEITITDVDLAGEYEPWRGPNMNDVRVIKDIYPPRFVFSYVRTGADGKVIAQGKEHLTDVAFQMQGTISNRDSLYYEKQMLRKWVRHTLQP